MSIILVTGSHRSGSTWVGRMVASASNVGYIHEPIILIRHPAAFVSSLIKADWRFPFQDFLKQPSLMSRLDIFRKDIELAASNREMPILEQGILLWNVIHLIIYEYQQVHPEWFFVKHESLSENPLKGFKNIFEYLDLPYTEAVKRGISISTQHGNKVDAAKPNDTRINSLANIFSCKRRLTDVQIDRIREGTSVVCTNFYSNKDW